MAAILSRGDELTRWGRVTLACRWTGPALFQEIVCHVFGTTPYKCRSKLDVLSSGTWKHISVKFESNYKHFQFGENMKIPLRSVVLPTIQGLRCNSIAGAILLTWFNSSSPGQNGRHFADDIFGCIFVNENVCILIKKKFTEICS